VVGSTHLVLLEIYSGIIMPKIIEIGWHLTKLLQKQKGTCFLDTSGGCVIILSFVLSFCKQDTDERRNGRRPNLAGVDKVWPSRSDWLSMVIRIWVWIPDHFSTSSPLRNRGFLDICISHTISGRFVPYLAK